MHTNKINGKKYIGQTIYGYNPNIRWKDGFGYKRQKFFYNAIQKYGWNNFEHTIVASNLTQEEANHFEELLITKLDTMNKDKGYNLRSGGENYSFSEETRKKMSKLRKGRLLSEETKQKISESEKGEKNPFWNKHHTESTKEKLSKIVKERYKDPIYREKCAMAQRGKKLSEETKQKIGKAQSGANHYSAKEVICIETQCVYPTIREAAKANGVLESKISMCCSGKRKSTGGYHWELYENYLKTNILK